jgi:hypothetical protein
MAVLLPAPLRQAFLGKDGQITKVWQLWLAQIPLVLANPDASGAITGASIAVTGATPTGAPPNVSFGTTQGVGSGALTPVSAPLKAAGGGPASPGIIVRWLEIDIGGIKFWIPLAQ